jgi:hypothetical protein
MRNYPQPGIRPTSTTTPFYLEATSDFPGPQAPKHPKRLGPSSKKNLEFIRKCPHTSLAIIRGPCSRYSSPHPKKRDEIRRNVESRPANPPTTVICASRLPPPRIHPPPTPITGGDTPVITSPTVPISIQARRPTILDPGDPLYETQENYSNEHPNVNSHNPEGSGSIPRSHNSAGHHNEGEYTSSSQYSYRQPHHAGYPLPSQYPQRPSSVHSYRSALHLNGSEAAARGYAPPSSRPSSPACSLRPASIADSFTSQAYRAPRPTTRVRVPLPMRNVSRPRDRLSAPTLARLHEVPPEGPPLPQSRSQTSVSIHPDPRGTVVSIGPILGPQGTLRPMIGIDRYEIHKQVVIKDVVNTHIFTPVTTQFVR